jgi:hypothetical protein
MALTERQRRLYASAPRGETGRCGLSLTHPGFTRAWHLTNQPRAFEGRVGGEVVRFEVHPFRVVRPEVGTSGKLDLKLDIHNSGPVFTAEFLRAAAQPRVPVRAELNDYLPGDLDSQIDGFILSLLDIAVTPSSCSGTASSVDFLNREFPRQSYTLRAFPGLDR